MQVEPLDEGRRTFTTRGAYFESMDKPTSFGPGFSTSAGLPRLMEGKGVGVSVWVRADRGFRLRRGGRGDGARGGTMAHLLCDARNHYAALRNPPTDWALRTMTDRVIGGPPEAVTGKQEEQKVAAPQQRDVGESTELGHDGGPETAQGSSP